MRGRTQLGRAGSANVQIAWAALALALLTPAASAQQRQPFTVDDLAAIASVSDPQTAPDAQWVAYTRATTDVSANRRLSQVMLINVASGASRVVDQGASPRFSPDSSTLAYLGGEGDQRGLWLYDIAADAKRFLTPVEQTDHFLGHSARKNYVWSPDSSFIAFVAAEDAALDQPDPLVVDRILYKTRTGFSDNRTTHVWLVGISSGRVAQLTSGQYDEHSIDISPDGSRIVFVSNRSDNPDDNYSDDLFTVEIATGAISRVTNTPGSEITPRFSPTGDAIAYLATTRPANTKDSGAENWKLFIASSGSAMRVAPDFDRRISQIRWAPDGESIWFVAGDRGSRIIHRAPLAPGASPVQEGDEGRRFGEYSMDASGQVFAYTRTDLLDPGELRLYDARSGSSRPLTTHNEAARERFAFQQAQEFWFQSFDGTPVQGWVMPPLDVAPGEQYPAILSVHGGPHGMYGWGFSEGFQLYASAGFGVIYMNPRGSTGYGQAFADGTLGQWGGGDYRDLMRGVDAAVASFDWIDENRLGVVGGSYGGFMTNWIVTQTDRFKAAVSIASVSNLISFYGNSLYQLLIEVEFAGEPWDNYETLWRWSPMAHVKGVSTPTLFIHGERDNDVPIAQAEEMYMALKKQGVETVFIRYPREGHGVREPAHRTDMYRRILAWFSKKL